jgi:hypothetical protein
VSKTTYRVCFTSIASYKVTVEAGSEHEAIRKARRLWASGGVSGFTAYAGDTQDWDAYLITPGKGGVP